ncbi:MAG: hypothetical protein UZ11_BCD004000421 [Bacteroidetes bacterium OLB11]|nr:MAG: hypothetical protein UZ11_BCD004000421 [Bacteroidetes bacterium OLB11]
MFYRRSYIFLFLLPISSLFFFSCQENLQKETDPSNSIQLSSKVDMNLLQNELIQKFDSNATAPFFVWEKDTVNQLVPFKELYHEGNSYWFNSKGINSNATDLLQELRNLQYDGIDTTRYKLNEFEKITQQLINSSSPEAVFSYETKLSSTFLLAIHDLIIGTTNNTNKEIKK